MKSTLYFCFCTVALTALFFCFGCQTSHVIFDRSESLAAEPYQRDKVVPRTMVFAENEIPYHLKHNTLHHWSDRPLFASHAYRNVNHFLGVEKDIEICKAMGMDGLASLDHYGIYADRLRYFSEAIPGYSDLYDLAAYRTPGDTYVENSLQQALKSPFTTRLNGKLVVWNYGGVQTKKMVEWSKYWAQRPELRKQLLVFGDVPFLPVYNAYNENYPKGKPVPAEILEQFEKDCREVLDNCEGMILWLQEHYLKQDGDFAYHIQATPIYRDYIVPVIRKLLAEPQYQGKLIGTFPRYCYINRFTAAVFGEFGTEGLRTYLDESMLINPDMMVTFEWNEVNENTYFQPSVNNGICLSRIINAYLQKIRGGNYQGFEGDNPNTPYLIFTARKKICLGETIYLEMLGLPDRKDGATYHAQLRLKNEWGQTVAEFPVETYKKNEIRAITYRVPSEQFADATVLIPEIVADGIVYNAFAPIEIYPTTCMEFKSVLACLRDIVEAETEATVKKLDNEHYEVTAEIKTEEPLKSAEILLNQEEVYSYDVSREFDGYEAFSMEFFSLSCAKPTNEGSIWVDGCQDWKLRTAYRPYQNLSIGNADDGKQRLEGRWGGDGGAFILSVAKADVANAVLHVAIDADNTLALPLKNVLKTRKYDYVFPSYRHVKIACKDLLFDFMPDIEEKTVKFTTVIRSSEKNPVFHLRLIGKNGKLLRRTLPLPQEKSVKKNLTVFSDFYSRPATVQVDAKRIPTIDYAFNESCGDLVESQWNNWFDATLGAGYPYAEPLHSKWGTLLFKSYPQAPKPHIVKEDGQNVLRFSGQGEYMVMPQETIPANGCYTVDFEIFPQSDSNQVLLRSMNAYASELNLDLLVVDGKLRGIAGQRTDHPRWYDTCAPWKQFDTSLQVIPQQWNHIRIIKDFQNLTFEVNGKQETFPCERRPVVFCHHVFGGPAGHPCTGFPDQITEFCGLLKFFRVYHGN